MRTAMKTVLKRTAGAAAVVAVLLVPAAAGAQDTKTVKGTVTTTAPDAVTVNVGDREMTFKVDAKTRVTARGGSTATRTAKAEGKAGAPFTDIVKAGQGVEVAYHEAGMHAASIRVLPAPPPPPAPAGAKTVTTTGVVTAVSDSSLAIKGDAGDLRFVIDPKTKIVGSGLGTKSREAQKAGEKTTAADFVRAGDTVSVRYTENEGAKRASEVRVVKAAK